MGSINITQMRKELKTSIKSLAPLAYRNAKTSFDSKLNKIVTKFTNSPISQEIADGPDGESNILSFGNLFSFLGFERNRKPISEVRKLLRDNISLNPIPQFIEDGLEISWSFPVSYPSEEEIEVATPLPWDESKSWLREIEDGISGFGFYLFHRYFPKKSGSRSLTGLQSKRQIRADDFAPHPYLSLLMEDLKEKFND